MDPTRNVQTSPGHAEKVFTFLLLLFSTGAFTNLTFNAADGPEAGQGQAGMQLIWALLYAIVVILLFRKCKKALKEAFREHLLWALMLLPLASTIWSDSPAVSLRRGIALLLTCAFGIYLTARYSLSQQIRLLASVCGLSVLLSYPFGLLGLGTPSEEFESAWYGIFAHKNDLGRMMALSIVVFLLLTRIDPAKKAVLWTGISLAFVLLLLSQSSTALVALAAMIAVFPFCRAIIRDRHGVARASIFGCVVLVAGVYWASNNFKDVLAFFGRDITLTGRLPLWILSIVMAIRRPWLGYGYNAFWLGPGSPSERIWSLMAWHPPHAHNGLIELWLELGMLGVGLFLTGFFVYAFRAVRFLQSNGGAELIWPLVFLVLLVLTNITEVTILSRNNIFWILYTAVAFTVSPRNRRYERLAALTRPGLYA